MADTYSKENKTRIREIAQQLRIKHKAMEWGVTPVYLMKKEGLDYDEYDLNEEGGIIARLSRGFWKITKVIKAAIFFKERVVLVDTDLHDSKKPFGQSHELGHHTLEDHKAIFRVCSEHDLSPQTRVEMEFEANIFGRETLFPSPLMSAIYSNYPLAMETILQLNDLSGASIHSAAIAYVQTSPERCCLLTLKVEQDEEGKRGLKLDGQISSDPWHRKYGRLLRDKQFFSDNHNLSQVVFDGREDEIVKTILRVRNSNLTLSVHAFYNKYTVFALLYEGELETGHHR